MMAVTGIRAQRSARSPATGHAFTARMLFALALAALLVRMVVPSGWMPMPAAGGMTIALCTGTGPAFVRIPLPAREGRSPDHGAPQHVPCLFASLAAPALAMSGDILISPRALEPYGQVGTALIEAAIAPLRLQPPSRGPPCCRHVPTAEPGGIAATFRRFLTKTRNGRPGPSV